jgi:uncharacterized protein
LQYLYLHGFASSARSAKANFFRARFQELGIDLAIPDLNGEDFSTLTLSRQIEQVAREYLAPNSPTTVIGSSLGGFMAAWLAQEYASVRRLVLLAPAFGFLEQNRDEKLLQEWERSGWLLVYHYGYERSIPVHYEFLRDLQRYREPEPIRDLPTLILHGRSDEVIAIDWVREYQKARPWVQLIELDSDHSLTDVMPRIWSEIQQFLAL